MKRRVQQGVLLLLSMMLLPACRKEDKARWDVDLLGPLVRTTFTIRNLVADSMIVAEPGTGALTLLYRDELFALRLDTVIQSPDTSFVYDYVLPVPGPLNFPAGITPFSQNDVTRFDLGDAALRTLIIREGILDLKLRNMVASTVLGTFELPGATLPEGTAALNLTVGPGTPAQPAVALASKDLSGAVFDLRGPNFNEVNTLNTFISAQLDPNGSGATVTNQDSIIAIATYRDLLPQYARGYFGNRTVAIGPESVGLDMFRNIIDGVLDLDEVTLRILVENGLGVDIQARIHQFRAENTRTGQAVDLLHPIMQGPINLNRALETGGSFIPSFYVNALNTGNSNVDLFIENLPDRISYELDLHMNPLGDISNGNDFLYHDSRVRAELELEIPLRLIASNLTLESIVVPNLPGTADAHALRRGDLKLFATNGFPFSAHLVIDIVNEEGEVMGSVPVQGSIASGILGVNGLVQQAVDSRLDATLSEQQVQLLYAGGRFRIRAIFNTADQSQHIQLLDSYKLDLQITAGAHYLVNGDD
jgi:hypothetical protein